MTHVLVLAVSLLAAPATQPVEVVADVPPGLPTIASIAALTAPPKHHFVGYYGITPWNGSQSRLFCLEADFGDRLVRAGDRASICLIDPANRSLTRVAQTSAWNLQQGAMLHWLPSAADRELIFNDRIDGRLVSVIFDIESGKRRVIDRPIAALSHDSRVAIGVNFDRLRAIRPVTGYAGGDAKEPLVNRPTDDGLFAIDMISGKSRLLVSVDACARLLAPPEQLDDQALWLEHPMFSRDGARVFFIARGFDPATKQIVSVPLIIASDGTRLRPLMPTWVADGASHFDWMDDRRVVITRRDEGKWRHLLIDTDGIEPMKPLAPDVLTRDGHCTFSSDGRWMITDTYPDSHRRQHLFVMDVKTGKAARLASFYSPPEYRGDWRSDLHPRWDRDSRRVCIDSTHEGIRQVYVIELTVPRR
jgi:hypothetical protein